MKIKHSKYYIKDENFVILGNLKVLFTTTTTTASLPEFSLGATTHTTNTNSTKLGK